MHPLDNVIWKALTGLQSHLAVINGQSGKFLPHVSVLGGLAEPTDDAFQSLASLVNSGERVGLFLNEIPVVPSPWQVSRSGPMLEMMYAGASLASDGKSSPEFQRLGEDDVAEMLVLTELTKPGPFAKRTHEMGEYWGIRENGRLVAMAGERLRITGYTEVSAVCTHPDDLGHGYATALISMLVRRMCGRGEQPFLHVRADNDRAVGLYQRIGFEKRVLMYYVVLERD
jgi:ribosomal protein S18 acetylase RimI-like enzyme